MVYIVEKNAYNVYKITLRVSFLGISRPKFERILMMTKSLCSTFLRYLEVKSDEVLWSRYSELYTGVVSESQILCFIIKGKMSIAKPGIPEGIKVGRKKVKLISGVGVVSWIFSHFN